MRIVLELIFVILLGLGLGGVLSVVSIQNNLGFGAVTIGQWTAWPQAGSRDADPYTKAKVAANGEVPLGAAEGIAFHSRLDSKGEALALNCQYQITGQTPPARFWTLTAHNIDGSIVGTPSGGAATIHSRNIIRQSSGKIVVMTGPFMSGGNWVETSGKGPYELVLRLYDTQITSTSGLLDPEMPEIILMGCQS
ncbi:MAG: DUF1214 domain-containing protein [Hyphomicrobiales bacterium]|nr:MAG: DUF1214 domain-containing protein [Hyphomicrobiales bacterium]